MIDENHGITFRDLDDGRQGVDNILVNIVVIQQNACEHGYGSSIAQPKVLQNLVANQPDLDLLSPENHLLLM
ncbi:hypothetical protein ACTXT7_005373 [Hymenolepis weldensis]